MIELAQFFDHGFSAGSVFWGDGFMGEVMFDDAPGFLDDALDVDGEMVFWRNWGRFSEFFD